MDNKIICKRFLSGNAVYLSFIFILIIILIIHKFYLISLLALIVFCALVYYNIRSKKKKTEGIVKYIESLIFHVDSATKNTVLHFPIPMVVINVNGIITWYNPGFEQIFNKKEIFNKPIQSIIKEVQVAKLLEDKTNISETITYNNKTYNVLGNLVKIEAAPGSEYMLVLYWLDVTELENIQKKYQEERPVTGIIMVDNYAEVMQDTEEIERPQLLAEIDRRIANWFSVSNGILKRFERDKYLLIFEKKYLNIFEEKRFTIMKEIKEINENDKIPVTLSIGIGVGGTTILQGYSYARAAIDIALGRGGDQVVIKKDDNLKFYGGKTKELEKRTKVKARVVSYALRELILQSDQVIIMGHKNADMDSIGAAVGLCSFTRNKGKDYFIVMGEYNPSVNNVLSRLKALEEYNDVFISRTRAMDIITDKTTLIVVDTHRASFTESPKLLEQTNNIVIIDHHRRSAEYIENVVLAYHEPYASSTCELVTEIIQYIDEKVKLNVTEAEALYAGIAVDTKSFSFKTGVRTFEAASFLRQIGIDTTSVKKLFQSDLKTYIIKSDIVRNIEIYNNIGISTYDKELKNAGLIIAQAADEILNIVGIKASFVMCYTNGETIISGRSLGSINVQLILERLGGGGHLTVAGAQLQGVKLPEAKEMLKDAIKQYLEK